MRSAIRSFPDDETGSFSAVHLGLTGEGSERGRLYEGGTVLLCSTCCQKAVLWVCGLRVIITNGAVFKR